MLFISSILVSALLVGSTTAQANDFGWNPVIAAAEGALVAGTPACAVSLLSLSSYPGQTCISSPVCPGAASQH